MKRGFFISFEGPEGSGKSSQCKRLAASLRKAGHSVVAVRDPGSTELGRALRRVLLHSRQRLSPMAEALLFFAGRVQLMNEQILPALRKGKVVITDRFHDSTIAYQGFGGGLDVRWLDATGRAAVDNRLPDLTLLLDLPVEAGFARLKRTKDRMERKALSLHRRVRNGYLELARRNAKRIVRLSAMGDERAIAAEVLAAVQRRLRNPRGKG